MMKRTFGGSYLRRKTCNRLAFLAVFLFVAQYLPAQISGTAPQLRLRETDQTLPAGYWRIMIEDDVIRIEKNTNAAASFATYNTYFHNYHHPTGGGAIPDGQNLFIGQDAGNYTGGSTATATYESSYNIGIGRYSLNHFTLASYSVGLGNNALRYVTTGNANTALGFSALTNVTQGYNNVAVGTDALYTNLIGNSNIALGYYAGAYETGSSKLFINNQDRTNTAGDTGKSLIYGIMAADPVNQVLNINGKVKIDTSGTYGAPNEQIEITGNIRIPQTTATTGIIKMGSDNFIHAFKHPTGGGAVPAGNNFFAGDSAGNLTMGATATSIVHSSYNTGIGVSSLSSNTKGYGDSAIGFWSLNKNTEGYYNSAGGYAALYTNTTGNTNTAFGGYSLFGNSIGSGNIALGYNAGAYETGSNALYINNVDQENTASDKAYSLLYGTFAGVKQSITGQTLRINGAVGIGVAATATEQLLITPNSNTIKGIVIKGAASQSANLLEFQDSSANIVAALKDCTAIGTTITTGLLLANNTAAANGAQQRSPALVLRGQGWKTDGTAASQNVEFKMDVLPVQGAANPTGTMYWTAVVDAGGTPVTWTPMTLTSAGVLTTGGTINSGPSSNIVSGGNVYAAATGYFILNGRSVISSSADGILSLGNNAASGFTRLNFGGATSSFAGVGFDAVNGFTLQSAAGTATWNDASTAGSGTVANRYLFGIAAPTLSSTNASVTYTVASNLYLGAAPVAGSNVTITTAYSLLADGTIGAPAFRTNTALITTTNSGDPVFGTDFIGGVGGPTTAAQNGWMKMLDSTGATVWIPVWK